MEVLSVIHLERSSMPTFQHPVLNVSYAQLYCLQLLQMVYVVQLLAMNAKLNTMVYSVQTV